MRKEPLLIGKGQGLENAQEIGVFERQQLIHDTRRTLRVVRNAQKPMHQALRSVVGMVSKPLLFSKSFGHFCRDYFKRSPPHDQIVRKPNHGAALALVLYEIQSA